MRIPIFSHRSNPSIDRWICKKKLGYVEGLISECLADWLDPANPSRGILLRGRFLPEPDTLQMVAGSGFDSAWAKLQSGYAGPLVWQLKTDGAYVEA